MRLAFRHSRSAFSLLEMVLALAIGMLLLLALYVAFNTYLGQAQAGRDAVAESTLARNVLSRIANDILGQVGPDDFRVNAYPPATTDPNQVQGVTPMYKYNLGVYYEQNKALFLSNYRVRKLDPAAVAGGANAVPETTPNSDLRTTVYWLATNGSQTLGLARRQFDMATDVTLVNFDPTTTSDQDTYIIAPEVKAFVLDFHNPSGTGWGNPEWYGSTPLYEGGPNQGPPAAIKISITLRRNLGTAADDDGVDGATYTQIVAVPTCNSFPPLVTTTQP